MKTIQILINAKDEASAVFDKLQTKVAAVGAAILGYFGIKAFTGVVNGAADFETAMSRVQAATGASKDEMRELESAVKSVAKEGFTNTQTAAGLETIAKAGVDAKEAVAGLPGVMALAKADNLELAQSAEYLTKIIAGMGEKFGEAGRYADVLALGANASNTSVTGLAQAMSYTAPAAKAVGLSLEQTVALLGKFADNGIDASRAGTALNGILSQFLDPASKFRNELALVGITTNDFGEAIKQLAAAGPRGANAILAVGMEAGPALRGLLNGGIGALEELTQKLKGAEGSAAATAKTLRDNLNGSLGSLSNAWEAVKDVLGAPVLPVLKQGVDELTAAFRRATEDGTVQRFGESIATAMRNGIQFVREFMATVDFAAVIARLQKFADDANATFTRVGEYATNAGNAVQLAYGVMTSGGNAVLTVIYGIAAAYTEAAVRIVEFAAKSSEALSKIAIGSAKDELIKQAGDMREVLVGLQGVRDAFVQKTQEALEATAKSAETARNGFAGLAGATDEVAASTDTWALAVTNARIELERANKAQGEATVKAQASAKAATDQAAATKAAQESAAALRDEYARAVSDGNWQRAAELQDQLNKALRGMKASAQDAADAAALVDAAFGRLGVTSTAKLKQMAESARADFETIRSSGTATAEDLSRAFKVAAEAAIAANKGIAPAWVTAEAGVRGYKIAVDEAGRATLEVASRGSEGLERMTRSWHMSREAIEAQAEAMDKLMERYTMSGEMTERQIARLEREAAAAEKTAEAYRKKWNMDKEGYSLNTAGERALQGETQEDIDADIAKRYGQENVDNPDAQRARQLAVLLSMMSQLGGQVRDPATSKQIADMRSELQELEAALLNGIGAKPKDGAPAAPAPPTRPSGGGSTSDDADDGRRNRGGGSGVSSGPDIHIHLAPGVDLSNRAEAERMARLYLIPAIETLTRRGFRAS